MREESQGLAPLASVDKGPARPDPAARSVNTAYLLAALGWLTPCAGLHRFYLNRPVSGVLYLLTWGFLGIGTLIDLLRLPKLVEQHNQQLLHPGRGPIAALPAGHGLTPEQQILRIAEAHQGVVTVPLIALSSKLSLKRAQRELERLRKEGFCSVDVNIDGTKLYVFTGLGPPQPLDLNAG